MEEILFARSLFLCKSVSIDFFICGLLNAIIPLEIHSLAVLFTSRFDYLRLSRKVTSKAQPNCVSPVVPSNERSQVEKPREIVTLKRKQGLRCPLS